jgi:hypothetical protein
MTHLKGGANSMVLSCLATASVISRATMTGVHAPQARDAIEHFAAVLGPVVHALGASQQPRIGLELSVRRERHPKCVEISGRRERGESWAFIASPCGVVTRGRWLDE